MKHISMNDLLKMDLSSITIVDIRSIDRYLSSHIPNAIHIDFYDLYYHADQYLDPLSTYYIYCDTGMKSKRIVSRLQGLGYKVVNISDGYQNYLLRK